jgi:ribosomal protein S21
MIIVPVKEGESIEKALKNSNANLRRQALSEN